MARQARIEYPGHVISRGIERRALFRDDTDRAKYLSLGARAAERFGFRLFAWCLMDNHVHLALETGRVPLSRIMRSINTAYAGYFNLRHGRAGYLFQGRYKAILCDRDAYLLELVRYIHLNPARLKVPDNPWRYRWSSHGAYLGKPSAVKVDTEAVLGQFGSTLGAARRGYQGFIEDGFKQGHNEKYYETIDQRFLGEERFLSKVAERSEAREVEIREIK